MVAFLEQAPCNSRIQAMDVWTDRIHTMDIVSGKMYATRTLRSWRGWRLHYNLSEEKHRYAKPAVVTKRS